jgi:hypothetical protein
MWFLLWNYSWYIAMLKNLIVLIMEADGFVKLKILKLIGNTSGRLRM